MAAPYMSKRTEQTLRAMYCTHIIMDTDQRQERVCYFAQASTTANALKFVPAINASVKHTYIYLTIVLNRHFPSLWTESLSYFPRTTSRTTL